jgi:Rieske Fe-S protein
VTRQPREAHSDGHASRRGVLAGVGIAGLAGTVSACGLLGSSSSAGGSGYGGTPAGGSTTVPAAPTSAATGAAGGGAAAGGSVLTTTSEIPVGGGKVFASAKVVVTQPVANTFKGFSAICTHMQCTVDQVANGTIDCPCHGSQFSIKDGSVVGGPAPSPLPAAAITVTGTNITLD